MPTDDRNSQRNCPFRRRELDLASECDSLADLYDEGRARYVIDPMTGEARYEPLVRRVRM